MENAAEALKMAFAISVFIMAITVSFMLVTQARSTADVVFTTTDKQDYVTGITAYNKGTNTERTVGIDTIVPTIYRYAQENYGVIIIDGDQIVGLYDLVVENTVSKYSKTWESNPNSKAEIEKICGWNSSTGIKQYVSNAVGATVTNNWDEEYFKQLFGVQGGGKHLYKIENPTSVSCPWTSSTYNIMQRIKVDMNGGTYNFGGTDGSTENLKYTCAFEAGSSDGFIKKYQTNTFTEYYYAVKTTNNLTQEDEVDRIQIIYVKNNP